MVPFAASPRGLLSRTSFISLSCSLPHLVTLHDSNQKKMSKLQWPSSSANYGHDIDATGPLSPFKVTLNAFPSTATRLDDAINLLFMANLQIANSLKADPLYKCKSPALSKSTGPLAPTGPASKARQK